MQQTGTGPPWTCRLRAVVRVGSRDGQLTALAVVSYADTPVGPYGEALLAQLRLPLRLTVPWIVVDSEASAREGREHWGLPKELAEFDLDLDGTSRVRASADAAALEVKVRRLGPAVPVLATGVLDQPGRGRARLRFRGRARAAAVRVEGSPDRLDRPRRDAGPGLALDGVLRLGPARRP